MRTNLRSGLDFGAGGGVYPTTQTPYPFGYNLPPPPTVNRLIDTCENITFPQLGWWWVKIVKSEGSSLAGSSDAYMKTWSSTVVCAR